jgi:AcrR family transcriptional regulator
VSPERTRETKYRIAETAMALFLDQGYESVTVEAVAAASQVSRRTVFRHFDGKDELAFPDHSERLGLVQQSLTEGDPDDPVETVIAATAVSLRDFLKHPELVLRRYQLTRVEPELRNRELVEHERYVALTRAFLREHLPEEDAPYLSMALAALIDAMHRSALGNFARSNGETDAMAELEAGMDWIRQLLLHQTLGAPRTPMLVAVLPDSPQTRRSLENLRASAEEL